MNIDIKIDAQVLYKMYEYAAYAKFIHKSEIAGWGHYNATKGIYKLAPLTKQIASAGEVDNFPNEILNDVSYDISDLVVQWHSHVDMACNPSQTDLRNIIDTVKLTGILISIIVNCKNEYKARLDIYKAGELILQEPITLDMNLVSYYDNPDVYEEVNLKLRKPKIKKVKAIERSEEDKVYDYRDEVSDYNYVDGLWYTKHPIDYADLYKPPKSNGKEITAEKVFKPPFTEGEWNYLRQKFREVADNFGSKFSYTYMNENRIYANTYASIDGGVQLMITKTEFKINNQDGFTWNDFLIKCGIMTDKYKIKID